MFDYSISHSLSLLLDQWHLDLIKSYDGSLTVVTPDLLQAARNLENVTGITADMIEHAAGAGTRLNLKAMNSDDEQVACLRAARVIKEIRTWRERLATWNSACRGSDIFIKGLRILRVPAATFSGTRSGGIERDARRRTHTPLTYSSTAAPRPRRAREASVTARSCTALGGSALSPSSASGDGSRVVRRRGLVQPELPREITTLRFTVHALPTRSI